MLIGLILLVPCRSRSCRLPYIRNWHHSYVQCPTPRRQRQRRPRLMDMRTHTRIAQAPRLPCSFTAAAQRGTVQLPFRGMKREKDGGKQAVIDCHQTSATPPPVSLSSLFTNDTQVFIRNCFNKFALFLCFFSCFFQWHPEEFTFCMNIFFTLIFFSWKRHLKTEQDRCLSY